MTTWLVSTWRTALLESRWKILPERVAGAVANKSWKIDSIEDLYGIEGEGLNRYKDFLDHACLLAKAGEAPQQFPASITAEQIINTPVKLLTM